MKISATQILASGAVGIVGLVVIGFPDQVRAAASAAGTAVNPTDPGNLVNRTVNQFGDLLDDADDNDSFSIGSALFDLVQRIKGIPAFDPNAKISPPAAFFDANQLRSVAL